ncbi:hypothetical protein [Clostridium sp.]|uniref:hypothetical protein n=1 Tax=Clostridium sp. TaxID=1506 RepID=UPI003F3357A0
MSFEQTWMLYEKQRGTKKKIKARKILMLAATLVCLATGVVVSAEYMRRQDYIEYSFETNPKVVGVWQVVAYVAGKENFNPEDSYDEQEFYIRQLTFEPEGTLQIIYEEEGALYELENSKIFWTKNHIVDKGYRTDSNYSIEKIDETEYMFYEWKNGDYITREREQPGYYVLKQIFEDTEIITVENQGKKDDVNQPFIDNDELKGKWTAIDFVKDIEDFNFKKKKDINTLYLRGLNIFEEGQIEVDLGEGFKSVVGMRWSEDVIINMHQQTASQCILKKIRGTTYMFYEWKSGDYIIRGLKPYYYVLKKEE